MGRKESKKVKGETREGNPLMWLIVVYIYLRVQPVMLVLVLLGASEEVQRQTVQGNVIAIPIILLAGIPTFVMIKIVKRWKVEEKAKKVARVLLIIVIVLMMDVVFYYTGGFSVLRNVDNFVRYAKEEKVEKKLPDVREGSIKLETEFSEEYGYYYYNEERQDLYRVTKDEIKTYPKYRREEGDGRAPYYKGWVRGVKKGKGVEVAVYEIGEKDYKKPKREVEFAVNNGDYTYKEESTGTFQLPQYFTDIYVDDIYGLGREGDVLYIEKEGEAEEFLGISEGREGLVLIHNGEQLLIRSLNGTKVEDLSEIGDMYVGKGEWGAYIQQYSDFFEEYIRVSELIEWEN